MGTPWTEPPSGGWLRPSLRHPPNLLELPSSPAVAEPPTSQPDPFIKALDESVLAVGPSTRTLSSRSEWLYTLARTMATTRDGLRAAMTAYPKSAFDSLTDLELDYVGTLAKCSLSLNSFIGVIHADPDNLLFCGSCLTHSRTLVTEHDWESILHQCGRNVSDARDRLIESATSSIEHEVQEWDAFQHHT